MLQTNELINTDEKNLWTGSPKFWPFLFNKTFSLFVFVLGWIIAFILIVYFQDKTVFAKPELIKSILPWLAPSFGFIIIFLILNIIYTAIVFFFTKYTITDKKVIIQKGIISKKVIMLDFDKITNSEVQVGLFDRLCGGTTGSILISTPTSIVYVNRRMRNNPYWLVSIPKPFEVYKVFREGANNKTTGV
ncbi:MAG: PH domain-containing protein [bacterium]